jgi:hypothetical protein
VVGINIKRIIDMKKNSTLTVVVTALLVTGSTYCWGAKCSGGTQSFDGSTVNLMMAPEGKVYESCTTPADKLIVTNEDPNGCCYKNADDLNTIKQKIVGLGTSVITLPQAQTRDSDNSASKPMTYSCDNSLTFEAKVYGNTLVITCEHVGRYGR